MRSSAPRPVFGLRRALWLGALVIGLIVAAVALALRAMALDEQVHRQYERSLATLQLALEIQTQAGALRTQMGRAARGPQQADAIADRSPLAASVQAVRDQLRRLEALAGPHSADEVEHVGAALGALLRAESAQGLEQVDVALGALVASMRHSTDDAAARAEGFTRLARTTLIAFSAIIVTLMAGALVFAARGLRATQVLMRHLDHLAHEDALTGVTNRRGLDQALPVEFARARRTALPLALVMLDLDWFKRFNDRRGHAAGDVLLRGVAQAWLKQLRPTDLLARYGGEEFTLLLPACDAEHAAQLVERLRPLMLERQTFSAGIAVWDGDESMLELQQRADRALLTAKKAGRNRTMIAGREPQATLPLRVA